MKSLLVEKTDRGTVKMANDYLGSALGKSEKGAIESFKKLHPNTRPKESAFVRVANSSDGIMFKDGHKGYGLYRIFRGK